MGDRPELSSFEERLAEIERRRLDAEESAFLAGQIKDLSLSDDPDEEVVTRVAAALSDRVAASERSSILHLQVWGQPKFLLDYRPGQSRIEIDDEPVDLVTWLAGLRAALRAGHEPEPDVEL